jgi:hypothetical protein
MNMLGCISTTDEFSNRDRLIAELSAMRYSCANAIALNERFKDLLRRIAYPRRGTDEEKMDIFDAAKLIQSNFTAEELGDG